MEITVASVSLLAVSVAIVVFLCKILNRMWLRPKKLERALRKTGFSGNSYRFMYGDMKDMFQMLKQAKSRPISLSDCIVPRLLPLEDQTIKKYGKNSFVWMGPTPKVIIMDPDLIKEVFLKIDVYQKPTFKYPLNLIVKGIVGSEGQKWASHRKIINTAFHLEKLKNMFPAFCLSCTQMVDNWEKLISSDGSCELDVWPYLQNLTADVISRTAFGSSYLEGRRIFQLLKEQSELIMKVARSANIRRPRFLPTTEDTRIKDIEKEIEFLLKGIINKREKALKEGETDRDDLLGILLDSNRKEMNENTRNGSMSTKEVIEECKVFYLAGQETTADLLAWAMVLLSKHQEWQTRARDEILQVFGKEKKPDYHELSQIKIIPMILYEVLRLYPPAPLVGRLVHKETKLGKYLLPAGASVCVPIMLVHHDSEIWGDDAKNFNPERFSEGVSKATKGKTCFLPFGWGPRICIGQNFSLMEAKIALVTILQHFQFELSPSYAHAPSQVLTLQPEHGAHIILHTV